MPVNRACSVMRIFACPMPYFVLTEITSCSTISTIILHLQTAKECHCWTLPVFSAFILLCLQRSAKDNPIYELEVDWLL